MFVSIEKQLEIAQKEKVDFVKNVHKIRVTDMEDRLRELWRKHGAMERNLDGMLKKEISQLLLLALNVEIQLILRQQRIAS